MIDFSTSQSDSSLDIFGDFFKSNNRFFKKPVFEGSPGKTKKSRDKKIKKAVIKYLHGLDSMQKQAYFCQSSSIGHNIKVLPALFYEVPT